MLWRQPYAPRQLEGVTLPKCLSRRLDQTEFHAETYVIYGGFSLDAVADIGIWERLLNEEFPEDVRIVRAYIRESWTSKEIKNATAMVPPSFLPRTVLIYDALGEWANLVQPESTTRGFAAIIRNSIIELLFVGPPTEETWDDFRLRWQSARTEV